MSDSVQRGRLHAFSLTFAIATGEAGPSPARSRHCRSSSLRSAALMKRCVHPLSRISRSSAMEVTGRASARLGRLGRGETTTSQDIRCDRHPRLHSSSSTWSRGRSCRLRVRARATCEIAFKTRPIRAAKPRASRSCFSAPRAGIPSTGPSTGDLHAPHPPLPAPRVRAAPRHVPCARVRRSNARRATPNGLIVPLERDGRWCESTAVPPP